MIRRFLVTLCIALSGAVALAAQDPGMAGMQMGADSSAMMPIPMPRGMIMLPGLVGLTPPVAPFLPGVGVDPSTVPMARPSSIVPLKDGDTLDLTAGLLRRTIYDRTFVMYGFNGQVPGPLIRVAQNSTIIVRF
ncbi:MAG: hypothetical protein ACREL4_02360, partial [Gemmatimonadales bacterium]